MRSPGCAIALFITLRLASAIPTCPTQMMSSEVRVDDQQSLNQSISNLTSVPYDQSNCVTLIILNRENYTYRIDLVELLKIKSNFVIIGLSLQQVKLDCTDTSNDTDNPLSGLQYVGFYQIAFYDCKLPLWMENITSVDMEEVTFSGSKEGAVNIFNCHNVNIVNCSFENNNSTGQFARARFQGSSGGLSIGMYRNTAPVHTEAVSVGVHSCRFINNKAHAFGSDVHTATSLLTRNIIIGRGAGMSLTIDSNNTVHSYITHNYFEKNTARVYGGGLYFLVNSVTKNQTYLFSENAFIDNQALLTSGAMIYGLVGMVHAGSNITVNVLRNYFEGNRAQLGGAFRFQRPTGNQGNYLVFNNCTFIRNMAVENGAAIGISKAQFFNFDQHTIPITITNCTFSENYSLRGGTVFSAYTAVAFSGSNSFMRNQGVALNLLASAVKFYGDVEFIKNNVQKFDGGALYMTSFSQMTLYNEATLNFVNNTGSFGSAIVVESLSRLTQTIFGTTNLCFVQYHDSSASPYTWRNVSINFTGNEAVIGSAVFINNAQHCLSNSNADDVLFDWPFMHYSVNNNTGQINSTDRKFYVQTPLTRFDVTDNMVETFPGQTFPLTVKSFDLSNLPAAGILQLTLQNNSIGLDPSAIIITPIHQSHGFTYDVANFTHNSNIEVTIRAFKSASQVESPNTANLEVAMLPCPPGNILKNKCQCDRNDELIVDCFENYTGVILRLGLWGYSSNDRLGYYQCPHGYCQCIEVNQNGNTLCSSIYHYNASDQQCNCDRKGILCGQCTDGAGVTALLNRCVHCSDANAILIGAVLLIGITVSSILLLCHISLPAWLYPFLFYIQITGYVTDGYQTSFSYLQQTNLYVSSALSLYFPYDFCLFSGMTPVQAYTLKYIPSIVSLLVLVVIVFIKRFKSFKCIHMEISLDGLWILIILIYSHTIYTSLSILHCPQVANINGKKKVVWFIDGTVECFTGSHAALAIFAIIVIAFSITLMVFTLFVSLRKVKRRWALDLSKILTKPFKCRCEWWSTVELLRRYLIIIIIVTIPGNHAPMLLLLIVYILLYGYVQPFKVKFVNVLEFAFLVDILLLQMIKSSNDIQITDFSNVIEYQRGCGKAVRVDRFAFTLMLLLLYIPMVVTLLLIVVHGVMKLKSRITYLFKYEPIKRSRHDSFTGSYATTATAAAHSYLLLTDDGIHLTSQTDI